MTDNGQPDTGNGQEQAAEVTSPLSSFVKSITGGGKKAATAAPAKPAAAKAPAPRNGAGKAPVAPPTALPPGPLASVVTRNEFYRDGFRNMIILVILEAIIIVCLVLAMIVYINNAKPEDRYFATTADGRIMQLTPLDRPNMSTSALMSWVAQAATETMTFGFHDYQRRLQQSSRHFTKTGWETFSAALQKARVIDSVQSLQQIVVAEPRSAPVLVQQGVVRGKYRWVIRLPIRVTKRAGTQVQTDNLDLNLVVERIPVLENPNGVGIEQWIAQSR